MLATLAVSVVLTGGAPAQQSPAGKLVSKMLQLYASAQSLTGTITLTASDKNGKAQLVTKLQYQKPSKLYIRQDKGGRQPQTWLVTSDGMAFSYDPPDNLPLAQPGRVKEKVRQLVPNEVDRDSKGNPIPVYRDYEVGQIYAVAAVGSLGDRSTPLDIAIGRIEDLSHDKATWMTMQWGGKVTFNGVEANLIKGKWREYGDQVSDPAYAPGDYEMIVTDDGKLLRYGIAQMMSGNGIQAEVNLVWDVDLRINDKPDPGLFRVVQ